MRIYLTLIALAATAQTACNNHPDAPAHPQSIASQVCGKAAAVVADQNWVDAGVAPTQLDLAADCILAQDGNAPGMACGDSNWTLHYADGTTKNVAVDANQQYFAAGSPLTQASAQQFLVIRLDSGQDSFALPRGTGWSVSLNLPQNANTSEALAAATQALGTDSNQATLTLSLGSDSMSKPVVFQAPSGSVSVTAPKLGQGAHVSLAATGIPVRLADGYAAESTGYENAVQCPDQHVHALADLSVTRTCDASLQQLAPSPSAGYLQAKCATLTATFGCADGAGTTSTDCCAKDPRWSDCAQQKAPTPVCSAAVVTAPGVNNLFGDCKVSSTVEFTCPITVEGGVLTASAKCCADDPRWGTCGKL